MCRKIGGYAYHSLSGEEEMKKGWADPEHVGKITINIIDTLSKEFNIESKKEEKDKELLLKIAGGIGYQSNIYSGLQKNHDFAKRLVAIEDTLSVADAETLAMGQSPVIIAEDDLRVRAEFK